MWLAERAGRKLEPCSNVRPRGMVVIATGLPVRRNRIRPIGLLQLVFWTAPLCAVFFVAEDSAIVLI
jgi:hypothetical protein